MENNKKILVPTIIAVVTLILLAFGATYAYFTVGSTNNFGTKDLNANIQDMADAVVLEQIENELSLNVTRAMMSQDNVYNTYYASGSEKPAKIAKMSVAGDGRYACDYTLSVTKSASSPENDLYEAIQGMTSKWNNAHLYISNNTYGFYEDDLFPITYSGTIGGITKNTPQYITTNLAIVNTNSNQNTLKGKDITLTFEVTSFDCYLTEADESAPIYAIYDENEETLAFYQNHDEVNVGDSYDGYTVTEVYKNLNNTNYTSEEDVPWSSNNINSIDIVEPIIPKNTAWWFSSTLENEFCSFDIDKPYNLDTSEVTNMEGMFVRFCGIDLDLSSFDTSNVSNMSYMFFDYLGGVTYISSWNTSKVTNMSHMFDGFAGDGIDKVGLSTWDTSNVTDMSHMFSDSVVGYLDVSTWNTSNVEDMSYMFSYFGNDEFNIGNITRREVTANGKTYIAWDTSKVTNMESMFENASDGDDYSLDLRSWQVPLVTNYTSFNAFVESKITPPIWVN